MCVLHALQYFTNFGPLLETFSGPQPKPSGKTFKLKYSLIEMVLKSYLER